MKKTMIMIGVAGIIVIAGGTFLLTQKNKQVSPPKELRGEELSKGDTDKKSNAPTQFINMEAGSFYYSIKEIRAKKGDKITIVMTSKDAMHDFTIDEMNVKSPTVKAGETATIEFTADKTGIFEYYCSVGQHKKMGQVGKLVVE